MVCEMNNRKPDAILHCKYCPAELPNQVSYLEHCKACHDKELHAYMITHGDFRGLTYATSEEEACKMHFGWEVRDCIVRS